MERGRGFKKTFWSQGERSGP